MSDNETRARLQSILEYCNNERDEAYRQADPKVSRHDSRASRARAVAMGDISRKIQGEINSLGNKKREGSK